MKIQINDIVKSFDFISSTDAFVIGRVKLVTEDYIEIHVHECSHLERVGKIVRVAQQGKLMTDHLGQRIVILQASPRSLVIESDINLDYDLKYALVDMERAQAAFKFISENLHPDALARLKSDYNFDLMPLRIKN